MSGRWKIDGREVSEEEWREMFGRRDSRRPGSGEFTEIEVPPGKTLAECLPARPLGVVADAAISKMATEGAAGPAALVAWLLVTLDDKLSRKGYAGCWVTAAYTTAGRTWRLSIQGDLSRHYIASNLDRAIAMAEEWIAGLPEGRRP